MERKTPPIAGKHDDGRCFLGWKKGMPVHRRDAESLKSNLIAILVKSLYNRIAGVCLYHWKRPIPKSGMFQCASIEKQYAVEVETHGRHRAWPKNI
ncbi:hypothetical protein [Ethanoligenens harbinense]|uniref:hypothetical protein n=1 Tax=Ethanoligenens harbinense TaxID=253239 RepID=UPI0005A0E072|nr:hypothetical protein [Ethanoligenens harbinense]AVQ95318.1 hypothetical protein CXQ68_03125 [Ethanoligenens harbinense YUAN-3]AYF37983.1 hypothetical protein CXP51_02990 [Ethanoligenens harbinense]AYF40729.1 hypothetical protein CN246_03125 [Ethanoligenens harbinense]QCN91562.1 hypothetical protein DRA42_03130 [Ethanoligenens harbinense]